MWCVVLCCEGGRAKVVVEKQQQQLKVLTSKGSVDGFSWAYFKQLMVKKKAKKAKQRALTGERDQTEPDHTHTQNTKGVVVANRKLEPAVGARS